MRALKGLLLVVGGIVVVYFAGSIIAAFVENQSPDEREYLRLVRGPDGMRDADALTDEELLDLGEDTCDQMENGTHRETAQIAVAVGMTESEWDDFAAVAIAASLTLCPEHKNWW